MVSSPHALHIEWAGMGGEENSKSKNSHLVTDSVTSLMEGLITAQSKAVLELV